MTEMNDCDNPDTTCCNRGQVPKRLSILEFYHLHNNHPDAQCWAVVFCLFVCLLLLPNWFWGSESREHSLLFNEQLNFIFSVFFSTFGSNLQYIWLQTQLLMYIMCIFVFAKFHAMRENLLS